MIEFAEPPQIAVAARFKQKQVELLGDDAGSSTGLLSPAQGKGRRLAQFAEAVLRIDPERQVEVATFVPDLDALATELAESRDFLPQRLCDRADHRDRLNLREI